MASVVDDLIALGPEGYSLSVQVPTDYDDIYSTRLALKLGYFGPSYYNLIGGYPDYHSYDSASDSASARREFNVLSIGQDFYVGDTFIGVGSSGDFTMPFSLEDSMLGTPTGGSLLNRALEGRLFEKRVLSAMTGLPRTSNGFLNTEDTFLYKIQQIYGYYDHNSATPYTRRSHDVYFNLDFGFDGDSDGIPFEDYYTEGYKTAPWSTFSNTYEFLARFTLFEWGSGTPAGMEGIAGTYSSEASSYSMATSYRNPLTEVHYRNYVEPLLTYGYFYSDLEGDRTLRLGGSTDSGGAYKRYPKLMSATLGEGVSTSEGYEQKYTISYYYYPTGEGSENVADIRSRFKILDYVTNFSSQLLEDRMESVEARLGTAVIREADIKMQKNEALNYNLATSMIDDYTNEVAPYTGIDGLTFGAPLTDAELAEYFSDVLGSEGIDISDCVIASHARKNNISGFDDVHDRAVAWCIKHFHGKWYGEAWRRGYQYYGKKAIEEGKASKHYEEFRSAVDFATGNRFSFKGAFSFVRRTIQFFFKGLFIK